VHNIQEYWLEIKRYADTALGEWGLLVILILVGLGSFGLGRLSVLAVTSAPISFQAANTAAASYAMPLGGSFVASKDGTTYYYPWCGGAQNIKSSNQVWFSTEAAAKRAGYTSAKNCRGL